MNQEIKHSQTKISTNQNRSEQILFNCESLIQESHIETGINSVCQEVKEQKRSSLNSIKDLDEKTPPNSNGFKPTNFKQYSSLQMFDDSNSVDEEDSIPEKFESGQQLNLKKREYQCSTMNTDLSSAQNSHSCKCLRRQKSLIITRTVQIQIAVFQFRESKLTKTLNKRNPLKQNLFYHNSFQESYKQKTTAEQVYKQEQQFFMDGPLYADEERIQNLNQLINLRQKKLRKNLRKIYEQKYYKTKNMSKIYEECKQTIQRLTQTQELLKKIKKQQKNSCQFLQQVQAHLQVSKYFNQQNKLQVHIEQFLMTLHKQFEQYIKNQAGIEWQMIKLDMEKQQKQTTINNCVNAVLNNQKTVYYLFGEEKVKKNTFYFDQISNKQNRFSMNSCSQTNKCQKCPKILKKAKVIARNNEDLKPALRILKCLIKRDSQYEQYELSIKDSEKVTKQKIKKIQQLDQKMDQIDQLRYHQLVAKPIF